MNNGLFKGSCHCGRVKFQVKASRISEDVYKCNCSLCKKKSITMKSVHQDSFTLLQGKDYLNSYEWNRNIAEHFFCKDCGVYTHHERRRYSDQMMSNFACLDGIEFPLEDNIGIADGASHY